MKMRFIAVAVAALLAAAAGVLSAPAQAACVAGAPCPPTAEAPDASPSEGKARPFAAEALKAPVTEESKAASTLRWNFQNQSGRRVEFQLYSQRRNWVWPRANRVYVLPDARKYVTDISCQPNEKICFGAWVAGNTNRYWGVGYRDSQNCASCCYICGRGQTQLIRLLP